MKQSKKFQIYFKSDSLHFHELGNCSEPGPNIPYE